MNNKKWTVRLIIARQKGESARAYQSFTLEVDPDEYVLDAIERVWAFHDRSLTFRHACHHSTCGACGMLVNGVEKLTCITPIRSVTKDQGQIKVEPLRNFPVVSDLVVDMSDFYTRLEDVNFPTVVPEQAALLPHEEIEELEQPDISRLVDCIECGMCISACPIAITSSSYQGPAVLAAIHQSYECHGDLVSLDQADHQTGVWRCHSAFECSAVCPSNVDPGWRIMNLRSKVIKNRMKKLLGKGK